MELFRKNTNTHNKGSLLVDAAICMPLFIFAIAALLSAMIIIGKEEMRTYEAISFIEASSLINDSLGITVNDPEIEVYIDHVKFVPIVMLPKLPFHGMEISIPYRNYIGESPDIYGDSEIVYVFPKNEGNEKDAAKYHTSYCRTMKGGATKGLGIEKTTRDEAEKRGYSLCLWCKQDEHN